MKKTLVILIGLSLLTTGASAAEAVISPQTPSDILLNSSNSYSVEKLFDGSGSTPDSVTYSWQRIETSETGSGPTYNFTFDRSDPQTNTVKLIVSSSTESDSAEVTQTLRDLPNVTASADSETIDISDDDTVTFTSSVNNSFDRPQSGKVNYNWTVDGNQEDTTSNFTHSFSSTGTYTVVLNVSDTQGYFDSDSLSIEVNNDSSSSEDSGGGSGGGGGGGSGSSGETYDRSFSLGNLSDGDDEELDVDEESFKTLSFTLANDVEYPFFGIHVTQDKPDELSDSAPGKEYEYYEIDEENISSDDVANVVLEFEVENSWINSLNGSRENIVMYRYDNGWNSLETTFLDRYNDHHHYEAESPGLSYFAVSLLKESIIVEQISLETYNPYANEAFNISVTVSNTGTRQGQKIVNTTVGGQSYSKNVSLDKGESETYEIQLNLTAGTYSAEAGTESLRFEVENRPIETTNSSNQTGPTANELTSQNQLQQQSNNNESAESSAEPEDDGLGMLMMVVPAVTFFFIVLGGVGYLKRDELEQFLQEQGIEIGSSNEMDVPETYQELREKIDELGIDDRSVKIKMDHARMLLDQGETERAADLLSVVSDKILQDLE